MAHSKIDWQFHVQAYLAQHTDSKSIPDYARANGINTASARRAMRPAVLAALADQVAGDETPTEPTNLSDSVIKISRTVRRKALELTAEAHQQRADRASSDHPLRSDHFHESRSSEDDQIEDNHGQRDGRSKNNCKKSQQSPEMDADGGELCMDEQASAENNFFQDRTLARPSNTNAMTFGGYASLLEIDDDIREAVETLGLGDYDLLISITRHMQMSRALGRMQKAIASDYDSKKPWKDEMGQPMPRSQAEIQALFGVSQRMTELEATISRRKMAMRKQDLVERQAEHEAHPLTRAERIARTRDILAQRADQELSALDTSYLFVNEGLDIPLPLQIETKKEVSWLEPDIDTEGGTDYEELALGRQEFYKKLKYQEEVWLPARQAEIAAMIEQETAYQTGTQLDEESFARQEQDALLEGRTVLAGDDGDWDTEEVDAEPEEVW